MAHYRRKNPKSRTRSGYSRRYWDRNKKLKHYYYWMNSWPAWWDVIFHRRPPRRLTKALEQAVIKGRDPDSIAWPLNKNKHIYFW